MLLQQIEDVLVDKTELGARGIVPPNDDDARDAFVEGDRADRVVANVSQQLQAVARLRLEPGAQLFELVILGFLLWCHIAIRRFPNSGSKNKYGSGKQQRGRHDDGAGLEKRPGAHVFAFATQGDEP